MGLLTKKYKAWAKHPEKYTAKQVLNEIVADLEWLDEEQAKNCNIPHVVGRSEQLLVFAKWIQENGNHMTPEKQVKYFLEDNK